MECVIELEYGSTGQAQAVFRAIGPDNAPYAAAFLNDAKVTITASAQNPFSLLHTLEDLLACVRVAEEASNVASGCPL